MKHFKGFIHMYFRKICFLTIWCILLGSFVFPPSVLAEVQPIKIEKLYHLQEKPFREKLSDLPEIKRLTEEDLYIIEKEIEEDKWRAIGSKSVYEKVEDYNPLWGIGICTIGRGAGYLCLGMGAVLGEYGFWTDDCEKTFLALPITPMVYSLFDDANPLDALIVPVTWPFGIYRIRTKEIVVSEKKVKSPHYEEVIDQMEAYDEKLKSRNQEINSYNAIIQKEIDVLNKKIESHNDLISHQYQSLVEGGRKVDAVINHFNSEVLKTNHLISNGIMPEKFPFLSVDLPPKN
jgi:hypothetical protein